MPGAGKLWDHASGRYVHAQRLVTSHYVNLDGGYPINLRQYFKYGSPEANKHGFRTKIEQAMALEQHPEGRSNRFIVAIVGALIDELVGDRFDGCFVYLKVQSFLDTVGTDTIPEVTGENGFQHNIARPKYISLVQVIWSTDRRLKLCSRLTPLSAPHAS